jgi:hypothetical protein
MPLVQSFLALCTFWSGASPDARTALNAEWQAHGPNLDEVIDGSSGTQHVLKLKKAGKKRFGGIPNSRNMLFLQIFLKRAAKRKAENLQSTTCFLVWAKHFSALGSASDAWGNKLATRTILKDTSAAQRWLRRTTIMYAAKDLISSCTHRSNYLSIQPSIHPPIHLWSIDLFVYVSIYLSTYLPIYLSIDLWIYLSIYLSIHLSIYLAS